MADLGESGAFRRTERDVGRRYLAASMILSAIGAALLFVGAESGAWIRGVLPPIGFALAISGVALLFLTYGRRAFAKPSGDTGSFGAFTAFYGVSSTPAALSDAAGVLAAHNGAFIGEDGQRAALQHDTRMKMGAALGRFAADGPALAYRLANDAMRDGAACEAVAGWDGAEAVVRAEQVVGAARGDAPPNLLWTVRPRASSTEFGPESHETADYAFARFSLTGARLAANPRFDALSPEARAAAFKAADEAAAAGAAHSTAVLPGAGRAVIASRAVSGGAREILIFTRPAASDALAIGALPVALAQLTPGGEVISVNEAAEALLGPAAAPGVDFAELVEGMGRSMRARIDESVPRRDSGRPELARATRRDEEHYLQIGLKPMTVDGARSIIAVIQDATDREAKERQFVQSQKMLAVGQLAGGVAHDFNNLLTAILGHCDLMAMRRDETDPDFQDLTQIRQNANRAAALVRQLLAFSRQQKLDPAVCDLGDTLGELSHLLDRLIGERVGLNVTGDEGLWPVWIDQQQFEQVVLNLVVNARDAMPEGGEIEVHCENVSLEEELARDRAVVARGDYVRIRVSDQGDGMSDDVRAKVFEPFFTTKSVGDGTGLGLSTAYGIIKQTGGFIFVDTQPGAGSTFTILIPRLIGEAREVPGPRAAQPADLSGTGRILLVEDEAPVRAFAARALRLRGYEVIEAPDAEAALDTLAEPGETVDLVVSDVVMPGLDGPTWVREARRDRPDLAVIFTSGYNEEVFRKGLKKMDNCSFLPKPFTLDDLAAAVKGRLEETPETLPAA